MKFSTVLVALLSTASALTTPVTRGQELAVRGFWGGLLNDFKGILHELDSEAEKVFKGLTTAEQKVLSAAKDISKDGCNIITCGLRLGTTTATCLASIAELEVNVVADLGCIAQAGQDAVNIEAGTLCAHCWDAVKNEVLHKS